ncbi:regulator of chromosome condensation 1/beta-lactamase-inhibitor protein II [Lyophyllum atratum]|nr:regulator of chromosome condensation 1/beta-lactamase-inhibitor protein II [Lyophyllum atratum]
MFKRAGNSLAPRLRRLHSQASTTARGVRKGFRASPGAITSASLVTASVLWYTNTQTVHNDAISPVALGKSKQEPSLIAGGDVADSEDLRTVVWGSNRSKTLTPEPAEVIRTPSIAQWLDGVALRDLVLHQNYAACVDARGDVYQWGCGFAGQDPEKKNKLTLTLRAKDIIQLTPTEGKLYALSASGKVYALASEADKQELRPGAPTPSSDSWWGTGWLWGEDETVDFVEIAPRETLSWGEKIVSIDAGNDHVLAVTSRGRTFAHPVNKNANAYGQLGLRKFQIPDPSVHHRSTAHGHLEVELIPKSIADPYAKSTRATRPNPERTMSENLANIDDTSIRFCTNFFEIPVLKGVDVAQVATGGRTSFVRTTTGRVLGWGANEYGQIGLGINMALETIIVPTEVVLWVSGADRLNTKCLDISAGGDLTAFIVQRSFPSSPTKIDLLMCGNGQWGGLGSNIFSTAQSAPLRARNVSGLIEYSDATRSLQPIAPHKVIISPTGHVLLTLNTASNADVGGRDLVVWGKNYESELGNGKKASIPVPTTLETPNGGRFMLRRRKAKEVKDPHGKVWKRDVKVEQCAAVGPANSVVYWKIVS